MSEPEFKSYPVWFGKGSFNDPNACDESRVNARWMIRGMLMFNDLELADDPWDYSKLKPRK